MLFHFFIAAVSLGCAFFARRAGMSPVAGVAMSAVFAAFACWQVVCGVMATRERGRTRAKTILTLGGFSWTQNDFCRGWLVTGETGSGKTLSAINAMLWQVSKNCPRWGGICIDDKGLYWEKMNQPRRGCLGLESVRYRQPLRGCVSFYRFPEVAPASQPWAIRGNGFAVIRDFSKRTQTS